MSFAYCCQKIKMTRRFFITVGQLNYHKAILISLPVVLLSQLVLLPTQTLAAAKTWDFSHSTDYTFDNTTIEFSSAQAQLKPTSDWYNTSWSRRKAITIAGSSAGPQTNYQIRTSVPYDSHMQADFTDIRFTSSDGTTSIDYWLESKSDSSTADIWVKVPSIPATPNITTIYMYYGNQTATSASNGANTFSFYDSFNGTGGPPGLDYIIDTVEVLSSRFTYVAKSDLDNDGTKEIITLGTGNQGRIYHFDGSNFVLKTTFTTTGSAPEIAQIADIDNDGTKEIVIAGWEGTSTSFIDIWTWDGTTATKTHHTSWAGGTLFSLGVSDLDGDGHSEILVDTFTSDHGYARVYNYNLTSYSEYSWAEANQRVISEPMGIGDVDNDGTNEFIISGHDTNYNAIARIFHWTAADGITLEQTISVNTGHSSEFRGSQVYDIDGDGSKEILFIGYQQDTAGAWNAWLRIYSKNFASIDKDYTWKYEGDTFATQLNLFDYNNDGTLEISVNGYVDGNKSFVNAYDWNGMTLSTLFAQRIDIPTGYTYAPIEQHVIDDFDNDGDYEVIVDGYTENSLKAYMSALRYSSSTVVQNVAWQQEQGTWSIVSGRYRQSTTTNAWFRNSINVTETNAALRVTEAPANGDLMLFVRGTDADNNYAVQFSPTYNRVYWYRQSGGSFGSPLREAVYNFGGYGGRTLEVQVIGDTVGAYVDNTLVDDYTYTSNTIASGRVGLIANGAYEFSKVLIRNCASPEATSSLGSEVSLYDTGNASVNPKSSAAQAFTSLSGFSETATKNGGQIKYQISNDGGSTWYWYDSGWATTVSAYSEANTAIDIDSNIVTFPVGKGEFLFRAFLHSDGTQKVVLSGIGLTYELKVVSLAPLRISLTAGAAIQLGFAGPAGNNYRVWASTNVAVTPVSSTWTVLATGSLDSTGRATFIDPNATNYPARFYLISVP